MKNAPKSLEHPAFGRSVLIPTLVAVKWSAPQQPEAARTALADFSLQAASEATTTTRRRTRENAVPDPTETLVNHSETLAWATGARLSDATLSRAAADERVEWIAPVYQAKGGDGGVKSYFAINPTVLLLTASAAEALGAIGTFDATATIDERRTGLMKGFVVLNLPQGNAIELAGQLQETAALKGITNGVRFENIPYISPTCGGCGCSGGGTVSRAVAKCAPATSAHLPNDTFFTNQWGLQRINAPNAWPITKGDPNIAIAVLDQGVQLDHPDLNLWPVSYSTITHTNDGSPVGDHGTACAGIIGGRMDNGQGVAGLASDCRVMGIATNFADTEVAEGLYFAADNGARVVSMSFGVYSSWMVWDFSIIEAALQYCQERNVVLVAASGNENQPVSRFPGSDPRTICVGGTNRQDVRKRIGDASIESWWGASWGPDLDVSAPCLEIPTTDRLGINGYTPTDYTLRFNGTSSATPHVAALAGLILSVNPGLSNTEVRQVISETTDKVNAGPYAYLPTTGKPFGTWHPEVGYGRINVERALLTACSFGSRASGGGACHVELSEPEQCCVSPCDPPWRPEDQCLFWYEDKFFRQPLGREGKAVAAVAVAQTNYIEFRISYEHRLCLLGKQHGPLLYTTTLLPGETVRLYHSDRYRRITSTQQRYSVQTTFMQFLSTVHQARVTNSVGALNDLLSSSKSSSSGSSGGGVFLGIIGFGGSSSGSSSSSVTSQSMLSVHVASDQFDQSVRQSSQLTHAERSIVVSTFEEQETKDISVRTLHNANECRAVTYFVRQVLELYAASTRVSDIHYRIVAPNVPPEWHAIDDLVWLPAQVRDQIRAALGLLPKVGQVVVRPRPISLPTDGVVYDPELAHCCSCEPEREAAIHARLEKEKAQALKACLEMQQLELELQRRRMLLQKGELAPFEPAPVLPAPVPVP
jgi:Subtilase family